MDILELDHPLNAECLSVDSNKCFLDRFANFSFLRKLHILCCPYLSRYDNDFPILCICVMQEPLFTICQSLELGKQGIQNQREHPKILIKYIAVYPTAVPHQGY